MDRGKLSGGKQIRRKGMFKIEIRTDDGEVLFSRENYVYFKNAKGEEQFWEWNHFGGREEEIDRICETARKLAKDIEGMLPDIPMSPLR